MTRTTIAALCVAGYACHGRPVVPPDVFPMGTAWTSPVGESIEGPLATDGVRLFVATRDGAVQALSLATGSVVWRVEARPGVVGWGPGLVAVREEDGTVWGMEAETGHARWKVESGIAGAIPPVVSADAVLVAGEGLALLDPATGAARWSVPAPPAVTTTVSPVMQGRRGLPVFAALLRPMRTCAAQVSKPAGTSASFPFAGNASLMRFQIGMLIPGGGGASYKHSDTLSK